MSKDPAPFSTPEILDVTEVQKAKLHEDAETKRNQIHEREETKRTSIAKWRDSEFLTAFSVVTIFFIVCSMIGSMVYSCQKYPTIEKVPPCVEAVVVIRQTDLGQGKLCSAGATLKTTATNDGFIEIQCTCDKK